MPITEAQKDQRSKHIGSSDMAAILGLDPFRTPTDVWASKVFDTEKDKTNRAQGIGNLMENTVLAYGARELEVRIRRNQRRVGVDNLFAANLDAVVVDRPEILEAKTTGVETSFVPDKDQWGESMSDQVPYRVTLQVHHQLYCVGEAYRVAWVPAFIGGRGFTLFRVERNDALVEAIVKRGREFWETYVEPRVKPPDDLPNLEILKRIKREEGKSVEVADAIILDWLRSREMRLHHEKREEAALKAVIFAMADPDGGKVAQVGTCKWGQVVTQEITVNKKATAASTFSYPKRSWKGAKLEEIEKEIDAGHEPQPEAPRAEAITNPKENQDNVQPTHGAKKQSSRFAL